MTQEEKELLHIIREYEFYINSFNETMITRYNLQMAPIIAKNKRIIPWEGDVILDDVKVHYWFHGIGCCVAWNHLIIDFDYTFGDFKYKGFETYKLFRFVELHLEASADLKVYNVLHELLMQLSAKGIIIKSPERCLDTYEYILNENYRTSV